jgi:hypothetical protein
MLLFVVVVRYKVFVNRIDRTVRGSILGAKPFSLLLARVSMQSWKNIFILEESYYLNFKPYPKPQTCLIQTSRDFISTRVTPLVGSTKRLQCNSNYLFLFLNLVKLLDAKRFSR